MLLAFAVMLQCPASTSADIYRFQDADGNWHFSDRPPPGHRFDAIQAPYAQEEGPGEDLAAQLQDTFSPQSPLERATLAVLAVKHGSVEGSGFFVSNNGHILTNKHIVRPTEFGQWKDAGERLAEEQAEIASLTEQYEDLKRQLAVMGEDLARAEEMVGAAHAARREQAQAQYERMQASYAYRKRRLAEARTLLTERQRSFRRTKLDFDWQTSASSVQTSFQVLLKDRTELTAFLIDTSDDMDLALLKVDGHRTPSLDPAAGGWLGQGETVFAIGNPIGMGNALTSGVITTLRDGKIVTDAQILPGNSGGPLLNQQGEVIGVNVSKLAGGDSVFNQGFGMAIPIGVAIRQFPALRELAAPN